MNILLAKDRRCFLLATIVIAIAVVITAFAWFLFGSEQVTQLRNLNKNLLKGDKDLLKIANGIFDLLTDINDTVHNTTVNLPPF